MRDIAPHASTDSAAVTRRPPGLRRWLAAGALGLCLALLGSCGGGDNSSGAVTAVIGAAGGTVTGPDGVQVIIPPGALNQATTIGIARSSAGAPAALDAFPVMGSVYEFTPHDVPFNLPVTVSALGEVRQATGLYGGENRKLDVVLKGKLASSVFSDLRFEWRGELNMPVPAGS